MIHAASVRTFRFTLAELVARPRALRCRVCLRMTEKRIAPEFSRIVTGKMTQSLMMTSNVDPVSVDTLR